MTTLLRRLSFAGLGFCLLATCPRPAAAEVVVAAGHSVKLVTFSAIDQACHSLGPVTINVIEPPRGGYLQVTQVRDYPNFNALNTRSRCNTMKLPATRIVYQSAGTFLGLDVIAIEAIFPEGAARRIRIPVSVRPVAPQAPAADAADAAASVAASPERASPEGPLSAEEDKPAAHRKPKARRTQASAGRDGCAGACAADRKPKAPDAPPAKPAQAPAVLTPI